MAADRHLGFCVSPKITSRHAADSPYVPAHQIWWRYLKKRLRYGDFPFLKMAAGRHLGFWYRSKMALRHVADCHVYHHTKFGDNSSNGGRFFAICGKIQNGGVRHFEFVFSNSGQPTKLTYGPEVAQKIWCQSNFYFSRYRNFKILKIWLKTPIQAPKIYVLGGFNP